MAVIRLVAVAAVTAAVWRKRRVLGGFVFRRPCRYHEYVNWEGPDRVCATCGFDFSS